MGNGSRKRDSAMNNIINSHMRYTGVIDSVKYNEQLAFAPLFQLETFLVSFSTYALDSKSAKIAAIGSATEVADPPQNIGGIAVGLVSVTGTSPVYQVRVETVSPATASKKSPTPTGTLWGTNTYGTFTPTGTNKYIYCDLVSSASLDSGDVFALVLKYYSGTVDTSNYATFRTAGYTHTSNLRGLPFGLYCPTSAEGQQE
jgi:hypothetical protein